MNFQEHTREMRLKLLGYLKINITSKKCPPSCKSVCFDITRLPGLIVSQDLMYSRFLLGQTFLILYMKRTCKGNAQYQITYISPITTKFSVLFVYKTTSVPEVRKFGGKGGDM